MGRVQKKTEANKTKGQKVKILCKGCNAKTNHLVMQSIDIIGSEVIDEFGNTINWSREYQIIQCQGCEAVSFRSLDWFSEWQDYECDGTEEHLFPMRSASTRELKELFSVPVNLRRIYIETIECFNYNLLTLCAAGLRAIVEGICSDQGVKSGPVEEEKEGTKKIVRKETLEGKIAGLHEKDILTKKYSVILHNHRYLGNEALHELNQPTTDELNLAIDIIEHTLEALYELPEKANKLRARKAKRKTKK